MLTLAPALLAEAPPKINADELRDLIRSKADVLYLDVREPKEIAELGSVPGYRNIPVGQVATRLAEIPKDKPLVVLCQSGRRAGTAAETLTKNGYKVQAIGGLIEYREKKYELVYPKP